MRAVVVVLGDLNRSPRIVLHARALAEAGADVDLVGFVEPGWKPAWASTRLRVRSLRSGHATAPAAPGRLSYLLRAVMRGVSLSVQLAALLLWRLPRPDLILVQNPPGVPTLLMAWLAARIRTARFGIDWHNLTSSMVGLRVGQNHPLVTCTSAYERWFARRADVNVFVSATMRDELKKAWGIDGLVFRDRPANVFEPLEPAERSVIRRELFERLGERPSSTAALLVTSTSWSADEDFNLLLEALSRYDHLVAVTTGEPRVIMVITGRGPLRASFEKRFADAGLRHVAVYTMWLESREYPRLLAAADLGICLHRSSSGLDLPMKVLDMFGAGLPVCALDYGPCLRELVSEGANGLLFRTSEDLARLLHSLLAASGRHRLDALRSGVPATADQNWENAWQNEMRAALMSSGPRADGT